MSAPLVWAPAGRADGVAVEQALARNNSWYLLVPLAGGGTELRYASQSGNVVVATGTSRELLVRAAEDHADTYDTRA